MSNLERNCVFTKVFVYRGGNVKSRKLASGASGVSYEPKVATRDVGKGPLKSLSCGAGFPG